MLIISYIVSRKYSMNGYLISFHCCNKRETWTFPEHILCILSFCLTIKRFWMQMGPLLQKAVASFHLLPPTEKYVPPYQDPWRFW
jgi:hypothetical protein